MSLVRETASSLAALRNITTEAMARGNPGEANTFLRIIALLASHPGLAATQAHHARNLLPDFAQVWLHEFVESDFQRVLPWLLLKESDPVREWLLSPQQDFKGIYPATQFTPVHAAEAELALDLMLPHMRHAFPLMSFGERKKAIIEIEDVALIPLRMLAQEGTESQQRRMGDFYLPVLVEIAHMGQGENCPTPVASPEALTDSFIDGIMTRIETEGLAAQGAGILQRMIWRHAYSESGRSLWEYIQHVVPTPAGFAPSLSLILTWLSSLCSEPITVEQFANILSPAVDFTQAQVEAVNSLMLTGPILNSVTIEDVLASVK